MQSEIPDDVMMNAERLYDEGGYKTVPEIIAEAIMAERERCEAALPAADPQQAPSVAVKANPLDPNGNNADVVETLIECEEYFDIRSDADCDQDGFIPNKEMVLLSKVKTALENMRVNQERGRMMGASKIADAIELCDWSGCSIGNKEILKSAVRFLRTYRQDREVKALPLNWTTEKKIGLTIHVGRGLGLKYEACIKAYSPGWVVTLGQSDVIFDGAKADEEDAKAAAQADYEARILSTLSAQVQDVAGWQPIETAPKDGTRLLLMWEPFSGMSEHVELGKWNVRNGWVNTYGHAFSGSPTHFMPLPAAPAKQEGGHE